MAIASEWDTALLEATRLVVEVDITEPDGHAWGGSGVLEIGGCVIVVSSLIADSSFVARVSVVHKGRTYPAEINVEGGRLPTAVIGLDPSLPDPGLPVGECCRLRPSHQLPPGEPVLAIDAVDNTFRATPGVVEAVLPHGLEDSAWKKTLLQCRFEAPGPFTSAVVFDRAGSFIGFVLGVIRGGLDCVLPAEHVFRLRSQT